MLMTGMTKGMKTMTGTNANEILELTYDNRGNVKDNHGRELPTCFTKYDERAKWCANCFYGEECYYNAK